MNASEVIKNFNCSASSEPVAHLFKELATYRRPQLPEDEEYVYHD